MNKTVERKYRKCSKGELPKLGHIYFIYQHTAPKVFNGLYFECLLTDQKIPAYAKLIYDTGHIRDCKTEIWRPERFGRARFAAQPPASEGEWYPGKDYQRLFNRISETNGIALNSDMNEIIRIVHEDFPATLPTREQGGEDEKKGLVYEECPMLVKKYS